MARRPGTDEEHWRWILAVTMAGIPPLWNDDEYGSEDTRYSRNGTVHCADNTVYNRANAARAMTIATTLLRWLDKESDYLWIEDADT